MIALMASRGTGLVIGFLSVLIYTRVFELKDMAIISVLQMFSMLGCKVFSFGLDLYLQRKLPQMIQSGSKEVYDLSRTFTVVMMLGMSVFSLGIYFFSEQLAALLLDDSSRSTHIKLLIPAILSFGLYTITEQILRGIGAFIVISIYSFFVQIINLSAVLVGFYLYKVNGMIIGLSVARFSCGIIVAAYLWKYMLGRFSVRNGLAFLKEALPYYGENCLGYLTSFADQWIIGLFMTPDALAIYYVPKTIISSLWVFVESISSVVLANMSRISGSGVKASLQAFLKIRRLSLYAFVPLFTCLATFSYYIIDLMAPPEYISSAAPFAILSIAVMIATVYSPHRVSVMALCQPAKRLYSSLAQSMTLMIGLFSFTGFFGIVGIALAYVFARMAVVVVSTYYLKQVFAFNVDKRAYLNLSIPLAVMVLVSLTGQLCCYNLFAVPCYAVIGILLYGIILLRLLAEDDIELLEAILPSKVMRTLRSFIGAKSIVA